MRVLTAKGVSTNMIKIEQIASGKNTTNNRVGIVVVGEDSTNPSMNITDSSNLSLTCYKLKESSYVALNKYKVKLDYLDLSRIEM